MTNHVDRGIENTGDTATHELGIRPNIGQFAQQLSQVFFVGLTIGMQRTVVPVLAAAVFGGFLQDLSCS